MTATGIPAPIVYRGVTVTAQNERYAREHIAAEVEHGADSDLYLAIEVAFGSGGYRRAAGYLLDVPAEIRSAVVGEANVRSNMVGMRYADAVWDVVRDVKAGREWDTYTRRNLAILAQERQARADRLRFAATQL